MKRAFAPPSVAIKIARPTSKDEGQWRGLYADYAVSYPWSEAKADTIWSWLNAPQPIVEGFLAKLDSGTTVGFIHFKAVPRTIHACYQGYIEDLYVHPDYRRSGIAMALIQSVVETAKERGWPTIRWISRKNNHAARSLYNRIAKETDRITYELSVEEFDRE
jgi:ribosomal protein S18 acetylase RimI-like enzyme